MLALKKIIQGFFLNIHLNLSKGTLYALGALELDCSNQIGLDYDLSSVDSASVSKIQLRSFANRLGTFIVHPYSPLADYDGVMGSYKSWRSYTINLSNQSTTQLYSIASKIFKKVEYWIRVAENSLNDGHQILKNLFDSTDVPMFVLSGNLGPSDDLSKLLQLAKHNSIACRVLSTCPDRRPIRQIRSDETSQFCKFKRPWPSRSFDPVKLDFQYLESQTYPLIRLMTNAKE